MTEHKLLDAAADVLPVGLQPTPFGEVWQALQQVAAQVWDVDPSVYRAGIAWMWYALRNPEALDADGLRPLLVAALISEQAPLVKDTQTVAELAEYLRLWRDYTPTYPQLEALYSVFAARVEVRPISDAESQGVVPVADRRLAFYLRVEEFDAERPLTLEEVYQIAVRATPLGSRPVPYFALVGSSDVFAGPASAGLVRALWASEPAAAPPMSFVVVDSATGAIVHGFNQELTTYALPSVVLNSEDGYETYELPSVSLPTPNVVIGVPITGPVQAFWFTDEGRDETSDKTFTVVGNPLFDEDGSVARNELYDNAVPLSFMQHDGNMFEADSDSDIVRYLPVTDRLVLSIPGDSTTRGKSAWSVQVAKLFVLSYANTQLPEVQIELPINEVGTYGTVITLPTIDGEYESGGKTWKPSAWDIGTFGSSYTLNADIVAHLIFEEVQQYQEITLYMASGDKRAQGNISSDESHTMTTTADSNYMYDLFYDPELTQHFRYDYSNDYEIGSYNSETGKWKPWAIQSIYSMPGTTSSDATLWKIGYILYDLGKLWLVSNVVGGGYMQTTIESFKVRIYPKDQQYYAGYFNTSNSYKNKTISGASTVTCYSAPNTSTSRFLKPNGFPEITLRKILTSSTMERNLSDFAEVGTKTIDVKHLVGGSADSRLAVFTLDQPTLYSWINLTGNTACDSGSILSLLDADGNYVLVDYAYDYIAIGLIQYNGRFIANMTDFLEYSVMGALDASHPERLCWSQTKGQTALSCVWYYKKPSATVSSTGNFGQYNWMFLPDVNTVLQPGESCVLDDSGTPGTTYAYDSTKSYGVLQWQTESGIRAGATELQIVGIEQGGQTIIGCKNASSTSVMVSYVRVCVCSSSSSTVVSVYDSSNVAYNAFKLSLSGTDYYYVLDNTQTAWVIDLSSIGYSLSPITT